MANNGDLYSCAGTVYQNHPNWLLQFHDAPRYVDEVIVINRLDCCPERLNGAHVQLWDSSHNMLSEEIIPNFAEDMYIIPFGVEGVARVQIYIPRTEFLSLTDVEVVGRIIRDASPTYERIANIDRCPWNNQLWDANECKWAGVSRNVGRILEGTRAKEGSWTHTPCGCFIESTAQIIHFKDPSHGNCKADARYPVVCRYR
jgi:hypothetical protein